MEHNFIKTVKVISVQDWDRLVEKTYGKTYSFQQQDDCKDRGTEYITVPCEPEDYENDTIPEIINGEEMGVSFKSWLERDPKALLNPSAKELEGSDYYWGNTPADEKEYKENPSNISLFWERNFYPHVSMIVNDLHAKGILEAGEYGIEIDW
jgi:hypothetical protein